jgi:hypothetical protein
VVTKKQPVFDVRATVPNIGALPRVAAFRPDGVRSLHPTHSIAGFGKNAAEFLAGEELSGTPTPVGGAMQRLGKMGAKILLVGVGNDKNTFLHTLDEELDIPDRMERESYPLTILDAAGNRHTTQFRSHHCSRSEDVSKNYPNYEQALVDTIEIELKQTALTSDRLIITPGNFGENYIASAGLDQLGVPVQKFSNFLGETLDILSGLEIREVLLVAHVGKLSKVAAGIMNTHSKYADGRNEIFCAHAAVCGAGMEVCRDLMNGATTDACIEILDEAGIRGPVIESILWAVQQKLEHRIRGNFRIGAVMFSNVYGQLGMTDDAKAILRSWEDIAEGHKEDIK